jgi:Kef-type K+ transport system membrane component KefB
MTRTPRALALAALAVMIPATASAAAGGESGELGLVAAIGLAIVVASVLMVVFNALRLPALLAYIVAGLLLATVAGPMLGESIHLMEHISHLGLVFLLFIIGLEMDLGGIVRLGFRTAIAVLLQTPIAIAAVLGVQFGFASLGLRVPGLGGEPSSFFFFAVACALGSTAVVVKLLGDKFDLDSKAGRITVLTLIAQDIWAVLALSYVASTAGDGASGNLLLMLGGGAASAVAMVLFSRYLLSRVMASLAKAPDLLALVSLGWCFLCAQTLSLCGLSAEMGALIAGLTVGALPHHVEILAKVSSLRDFFMALFFVALGMTLPVPSLAVMGEALALVGIAVLVRMLLFTPTLLFSRLGPIVSLTPPINLAQISEFSLLLVPLGIASGALSSEQGAVISYGLMLSVVVSSFAIAHNYRLARILGRLLPASAAQDTAMIETPADSAAESDHARAAEIVMFGFFVNAEAFARELQRTNPELVARTLVIDYNLQHHRRIRALGFRVAYGDIANPETLRHHGIARAKVVLSTVSDAFLRGTSNRNLFEQVRSLNPRARFIATADDEESHAALQALGTFRTITPPTQVAPVYVQALLEGLTAASEGTDRRAEGGQGEPRPTS